MSKTIKKVVNKKKPFTASGMKSSNNADRTIKLSEYALERSARIRRLANTMGDKNMKDLSMRTGMAGGTTTRLYNASVCLPVAKAFQIGASAFKSNPVESPENPSADHEYYKDSYFANPNWLLHGIGEEPQKITTSKTFNLEDFLMKQFSNFEDSCTKKLLGLISGEEEKLLKSPDAIVEAQRKKIVNIFLNIDLFRAANKNAYIAYPSEPYMNTTQRPIVGFNYITTKEELMKLNGKECVVILKQGDVPVIRYLDILNDNLLLLTPNRIGSMIVNIQNELPYKIGALEFLILDSHMKLLTEVAETMFNNNKYDYSMQLH